MPKPNILIVDDTPANLELLETILSRRDYEVRKMPNGPLAIISAHAAVPDLILLDVRMPGMDGYEVCARLRADPSVRDVPVIFISALQETQDKVRAFTAGGVDYITKPFQAEEVLARVETHLRLHRLQMEMAEAKALAESANYAKSAFLANMSHELRTPLNAVLGYAQVLGRDARLFDDQRDHVASIERGGRYLLTLINDVLDLAKVEAGRMELYPVEWRPEPFFRELIEALRLRAEQKGVRLTFLAPAVTLPSLLRGDEKRLRQVLMNLIGNAVKFTPRGEVILRAAMDGERLVMEVEDQGIGISKEDQAQLFRPFSQTGEARYRLQGTGLGLAISQRLIGLMGGEIGLESQLGRGSCFRVAIPVEVLSGVEAPLHEVMPPVTGYERTQGEGPFHLVANDPDDDNRAALGTLLGALGFDVRTTANTAECVEAVRDWRPDILLTEIRLTEMDGLDFVRTLRGEALDVAVPIIALTGSAFETDKLAALEAGCTDYLTKPVILEDLATMLERRLPLVWRREAVKAAAAEVDGETLSHEQWAQLSALVRTGNIVGIRSYLEKIAGQPDARPGVATLAAMARRLDMRGLRNTVERVGGGN